MPSLKDATRPPKNLKNMTPVSNSGAGAGGSNQVPPPTNQAPSGLGTRSIGPIPDVLGTAYDTIRQWIRPNVPQFRTFPMQKKNDLAANSVAASGATDISGSAVKSALNQVLPGVVPAANLPPANLSERIPGFKELVPATLANVGDSQVAGRLAQTASGTSYRTLSNCLSATDSGISATINVAAFTLRVSNVGDVPVNSGQIIGLAYNTLYFVYYDDPSFHGDTNGFTQVFHATTTKEIAIQGGGRFYIGSILTPIATAPDTQGTGDSGSGAQNGRVNVLNLSLPTNESTTGNGAIANLANAVDSDLTTFAALTFTANGNLNTAVMEVAGPPGLARNYTSLVLKIRYAVPVNAVVTGGPNVVTIAVSTTGIAPAGAFFNQVLVATGVTVPVTEFSMTLPNTFNPSQVAILFSVGAGVGAPAGALELDVFDARIIATE